MAGKMYVFNCSNEAQSAFSVGGFRATRGIPAWSGSAPYQPQSIVLPRINHGDERTAAQFACGDNVCQIVWDSFTASTTITVPTPTGGVSLDDDLVLYVCVNQSVLLTEQRHFTTA